MKNSPTESQRHNLMALLLIEAAAVTVPVAILGKYFNFPAILREPAIKAFELFRANQSQIVAGYYVFMLSALVFIPLSYALKKFLATQNNAQALRALTVLGSAVTIFQSIGFIRWIFTMPFLTDIYFTQPAHRPTVEIVYETLNRYAGMSIGEHLGFLAMGSWTILLGVLILNGTEIKKWLGVVGILIGSFIAVSVAEHFGGAWAGFFGTINFAANTFWVFWLLAIALNIYLKRGKQE